MLTLGITEASFVLLSLNRIIVTVNIKHQLNTKNYGS